MNILVVAHYQNDGSPSAIFIHDQIKAYIKLGHVVKVIVPVAIGKRGWSGKRLEGLVQCKTIEGISYCFVRYLSLSRYGMRSFNTNSALLIMHFYGDDIIGNFSPDIIHAHTLGLDSGIGAYLKKRLGCPLVVTTHGSDTSVPFERGHLDFLRSYCNQADAVVAVSSVLRKKLQICNTQAPICVILNGFNLEPLPVDISKTLGSLVQVGNLIEQKRTDITIRALADIYQRYPATTLTIIGQGQERSKLEMLCQKLGVADTVHFLGQIPNYKVLQEMAKSQFFVMPSVREGFGIVYLEAMAAGCITIGTEGEGIADLIVNGQNGFLVPPDDVESIVEVITRCLEEQELSMQIAEHGRRDALLLTWEKNAKSYSRLFESLLKGSSHE